MAVLTDAGRRALLAGFATLARHASLHTDDPAPAGGHEVSGGQYARQPISWAHPVGVALATDTTIVFDVPGMTEVTHLGYWTADGAFLGSLPIVAESYRAPGTYAIPSGSLVETIT